MNMHALSPYAAAMFCDPPTCVAFIETFVRGGGGDGEVDDTSEKEEAALDAKLLQMSTHAGSSDVGSSEGKEGQGRFPFPSFAVDAAAAVRRAALCFVPDGNCSYLSTFQDPSYEDLFRGKFSSQVASPKIDASMMCLVIILLHVASLKMHGWDVWLVTGKLIDMVSLGKADNFFEGMLLFIFKILPVILYFGSALYGMYMTRYHTKRWYRSREACIMLFRLSNVWFIANLSYSSEINMCNKKYDAIGFFGSVAAPFVYRLRVERHVLTELIHIPLSIIMPGFLCPRSIPIMLGMLAVRLSISVPAALIMWNNERSLREKFKQKFLLKVD